jgi:hypothetical protein
MRHQRGLVQGREDLFRGFEAGGGDAQRDLQRVLVRGVLHRDARGRSRVVEHFGRDEHHCLLLTLPGEPDRFRDPSRLLIASGSKQDRTRQTARFHLRDKVGQRFCEGLVHCRIGQPYAAEELERHRRTYVHAIPVPDATRATRKPGKDLIERVDKRIEHELALVVRSHRRPGLSTATVTGMHGSATAMPIQ